MSKKTLQSLPCQSFASSVRPLLCSLCHFQGAGDYVHVQVTFIISGKFFDFSQIWYITQINFFTFQFLFQCDICPEIYFFLKQIFKIIFRERRREEEREGEKHQHVVASCTSPTGDLAVTPGMCPDQQLNWPPFCSQAGTQSTEPHQLGCCQIFNRKFFLPNYNEI